MSIQLLSELNKLKHNLENFVKEKKDEVQSRNPEYFSNRENLSITKAQLKELGLRDADIKAFVEEIGATPQTEKTFNGKDFGIKYVPSEQITMSNRVVGDKTGDGFADIIQTREELNDLLQKMNRGKDNEYKRNLDNPEKNEAVRLK